jgi:hypothetical protein
MTAPALATKIDGDLVSEWVLGFYPDNALCLHRVVRACRTGKTIEWEYVDGEGVDSDRFPISPPDSWKPLDVQ